MRVIGACAFVAGAGALAQSVERDGERRQRAERPPSRMVDRVPRQPDAPESRVRPGVPRPVLVAGNVGPIELARIEPAGERVSLVDLDGNTATIPLSAVGALILPSVDTRSLPPQEYSADDLDVLLLTDGQRHTGWLVEGAAPKGQALWFDPILGDQFVSLDAVSAIEFRRPDQLGGDDSGANADDTLLLRNGDRMAGFVEELGSETVLFETSGGLVRLPMDRVHRIEFANLASPESGPLLCLVNGSAFAFIDWRRLKDSGDILVTRPDLSTVILRPAEIAGVCQSASRIAPLSALEVRQEIPQQERWSPEPARFESPLSWRQFGSLGGADLVLPGATRLDLTLPPESGALMGAFEIPADSVDWVDCQVTIWAARQPIFEARLNARNPAERFLIPISGEELILTVQPRQAGATNTVVRLTQPLVLRTTRTRGHGQ